MLARNCLELSMCNKKHWITIHQIGELCLNAGVNLLYLPQCLPDLNPIEEFFAELEGFVNTPASVDPWKTRDIRMPSWVYAGSIW